MPRDPLCLQPNMPGEHPSRPLAWMVAARRKSMMMQMRVGVEMFMVAELDDLVGYFCSVVIGV
ncbi:hypothetical protein JI435_303090 [Parastagonospora nodorum SN15]|uniref:Uncharacterized protein n=1 Tax=Phaeosphaeria nodorum (strain SN15 / ATCC MYA-4574 / FGSC 10173) TaxID=321614 RepID=A0A7U2F4E0_PHANO|nr:hypothetical protein HBI84_003430 [Parastagonospora nodorum]QRC98211.1 hypothetical protein JI435_303090 [Parastagonospora nodorum SN15]